MVRPAQARAATADCGSNIRYIALSIGSKLKTHGHRPKLAQKRGQDGFVCGLRQFPNHVETHYFPFDFVNFAVYIVHERFCIKVSINCHSTDAERQLTEITSIVMHKYFASFLLVATLICCWSANGAAQEESSAPSTGDESSATTTSTGTRSPTSTSGPDKVNEQIDLTLNGTIYPPTIFSGDVTM